MENKNGTDVFCIEDRTECIRYLSGRYVCVRYGCRTRKAHRCFGKIINQLWCSTVCTNHLYRWGKFIVEWEIQDYNYDLITPNGIIRYAHFDCPNCNHFSYWHHAKQNQKSTRTCYGISCTCDRMFIT